MVTSPKITEKAYFDVSVNSVAYARSPSMGPDFYFFPSAAQNHQTGLLFLCARRRQRPAVDGQHPELPV